MDNKEFVKFLQKKEVVVLDGATGTNLQTMGLTLGEAPESWVLFKPEKIINLHQQFIESGSEVLLTCTFGGNRTRLDASGLAQHARQINQEAVHLAREAASGRNILIAGSIGPIGEMMNPIGKLTENLAFEIYQEQAGYLLESEVGLLVIETQYDLLEALTAVRAVRSISSDIALVCSFSFDRGVHTMTGLSPEKAAKAIEQTDVTAIGINCGKNLDSNLEALKMVNNYSTKPIWFKPNAGYPSTNPDGSFTYNLTPQELEALIPIWIKNGARLIGGCCGTSPDLIKVIKEKLG